MLCLIKIWLGSFSMQVFTAPATLNPLSTIYLLTLRAKRKAEMERGSRGKKVVREVEEHNSGGWNRKGEKKKESGRRIDKKGEQEKSDDGLQEKKLSCWIIISYAAGALHPLVLLLWTVVRCRVWQGSHLENVIWKNLYMLKGSWNKRSLLGVFNIIYI